MKRLTVFLFAFAFLAATLPVSAQDAPQGTESTIRAASDAVQAIGALQVILLLAVLVLAAIVVFFVLAALRLGLPLVTTVQKLIASRDDLQRINVEQDREAATYRARTAQAVEHSAEMQERTARILETLDSSFKKGVEAINDANKEGRIELIKAVNVRIDGTEKALGGKLDTVIETLRSARDEAVTQEKLDKTLAPIVEKIDEALTLIRGLQTTPPLPPDSQLPDAAVPPAAPGEPKA